MGAQCIRILDQLGQTFGEFDDEEQKTLIANLFRFYVQTSDIKFTYSASC